METKKTIVPIYTTRGDLEAYLSYPYLYSLQGDWIGWVSSERLVYSVHGHYVGWLADGPRILRKLADGYNRPRIEIIPPFSMKIYPPSLSPLAPMMSELTFGVIDVLSDQPELLPPIDFGELREDMD